MVAHRASSSRYSIPELPRNGFWRAGSSRIGLPDATWHAKGLDEADTFSRSVPAPNHKAAVGILMDWIEKRRDSLAAVGHRVVHGGPKYSAPQRITPEMVADLRVLTPFDPEHLPEEILLTEAFHHRFPDLLQVACFDTAFHHNLPLVARLLPIPRRYEAQGVRRYGFHGLSYAYMMEELASRGGNGSGKGQSYPCPPRQWRESCSGPQRQVRGYEHEPDAGSRIPDEYPLGRSRSRTRLLSRAHGANERQTIR